MLLGILLLSINTTYAKGRRTSSRDGRPSFGVKVGGSFNRTHLGFRRYEKISAWQQAGWSSGNILFITGGLTGEYPFSPQFAAAAEVSYEKKGEYSVLDGIKIQHETINLPISIKYYPENMGEGFSLQVGIQPSFIVSKKYYELEGDAKEEQKEVVIKEEDLTESLIKNYKHKSFDLVLVGGLEYTFVTGLKIGITMSRGLLERRENKDMGDKSTLTSIGNQIYLGYNLAKLL
ncbi:MAG: hypothetical protein BGO68_02765 [Candidatus Amoebophilus sp. 36-38]|nr:MAG: hypothetical protein BGO68_02765 [Candidatus Amoebophilus sp. 36-38]